METASLDWGEPVGAIEIVLVDLRRWELSGDRHFECCFELVDDDEPDRPYAIELRLAGRGRCSCGAADGRAAILEVRQYSRRALALKAFAIIVARERETLAMVQQERRARRSLEEWGAVSAN